MLTSLYYMHPPLSKTHQNIQLRQSRIIFHQKLLVNQWNSNFVTQIDNFKG